MSGIKNTFLVAMSDDFVDCLLRIPKAQQKKVQEFIKKFKADPTANGLNYEKINQAADPRLRSMRVDQAWRAIVLKPDTGNIYVLLWVDHHDEAYAWAMRKQVSVHPETGSLQILNVDAAPSRPTANESAQIPGLFEAYRDRELIKLGLPETLLPLIRPLRTVEALDGLRTQLPQEAWEALHFLACGESYQEVYRALENDTPAVKEPLNASDWVAALEHPHARQHFIVVENDLELQAILNAPLEKWRIFLHPTQRSLVERTWGGPVRVLGGAGTGKTVVAMHRANYLASKLFPDANDRILFTTFTRNLAADIADNLSKLCTPQLYRRIEVIHLDKWVSDFLNRQGYRHRVAYFGTGGELESLWRSALSVRPETLDLPDTFYREEWEAVVQAQGCCTQAAYLRARRTGRGVRLSLAERKAVWAVFEEYKSLLDTKGLRESIDAMRDARQLLESRGDILPYRSIIVDEAQDMSEEAFRLLRQMLPAPERGNERENDLFIVGDGHQRIYRHKVVLSRAGVNVRGRSRTLKINYRTTDEIRAFATRVLANIPIDDLDEGLDTSKGYTSLMHGLPPKVQVLPGFAAEVDAIAAFVRAQETEAASGAPASRPVSNTDTSSEEHSHGNSGSICLVARTQDMVEQYEKALKARGIATCRIRRTEPDDRSRPGLRLATMHRVKGLEFDRMVVAGMNEGIMPLTSAYAHTSDALVREEGEHRERSLLYVALTRARREVLLTAHGTPSPFLRVEDPRT